MSGTKRPRTKSLTLQQAAPKRVKKQQNTFPFLSSEQHEPQQPALPPLRQHKSNYHRPALLDHVPTQTALLDWFETVSKDRDMPWRQNWIDPVTFQEKEDDLDLRETLKRRAYQVWISEIMLQQTRVETVRAYYETWHSRWPTIEDLAKAEPPEVLSAWKGLGYYSRATRIHTAAKLIVEDFGMKGLLPELPAELEAKVPGVGRYTAGAISSIVFGHAVPILDGNVMRVLCRQMGLYANMKSKVTTDLLWEAADRLVKGITRNALVAKGVEVEEEEVPKSEIPSFWNQALMELGSTLCKPVKPNCGNCPVRESCMAYAEAENLAIKKGFLDTEKSSSVFDLTSKCKIPDIEDLCTYCEPMEEIEPDLPSPTNPTSRGKSKSRPKPGLKQGTLSFGQKAKSISEIKKPKDDRAGSAIDTHVSLFPLKVIKKAVRNEECVVCVIKHINSDDGEEEWLIEQRPDKGLLASLWQFPSHTIYTDEGRAASDDSEEDEEEEEEEEEDGDEDDMPVKSRKKKAKPTSKTTIKPASKPTGPPTPKQRKQQALSFVNSVLQKSYDQNSKVETAGINHLIEAGSITHLFSHIKLIMHVHIFHLNSTGNGESKPDVAKKTSIKEAEYQQRKWASRKEVDEESFGTGMRKCWILALKEEKQE
jgi:A/G-specific adenine glycosylase